MESVKPKSCSTLFVVRHAEAPGSPTKGVLCAQHGKKVSEIMTHNDGGGARRDKKSKRAATWAVELKCLHEHVRKFHAMAEGP